MKKLILLLFAAVAFGQNPPAGGLLPVSSPAPGGPCANSQPAFYSTADQKLYTCQSGTWTAVSGGGSVSITCGTGATCSPATITGTGMISATGGGSGTVTSVGVTLPTSLVACTGSPVTTAGTIACTFATGQTANQVLRTGSGTVAFGALTLADLPTQTGTGSIVLSTSPALTGTPTAPTQTVGDNTTALATDAFVQSAVTSATSALAPYLKLNGTLYLPQDGMYQVMLPNFTGWTQIGSTTAATQVNGTNGNIALNLSSTNRYFLAAPTQHTSIEIVYEWLGLASNGAQGIFFYDSTNSKIYELTPSATNTTPAVSWAINTWTYSGSGNPSFSSGTSFLYGYPVPVHIKGVISGASLTFSSSIDGGSTYVQIGTTVTVGTVTKMGVCLDGTSMNIFSLVPL